MKRSTRKFMALLLAAVMLLGTTSALAAYVPANGQYKQETGAESWLTTEPYDNGDENVSMYKCVTKRGAANKWDVEIGLTANVAVQALPVQIALVLDVSSSMKTGTRLNDMKNAVNGMLTTLYNMPNVYVSITTFGTNVDVIQRMAKLQDLNLGTLHNLVKGLTTNGNTNMQYGLDRGHNTFDPAIEGDKHMILVTDGSPVGYRDYTSDGSIVGTHDHRLDASYKNCPNSICNTNDAKPNQEGQVENNRFHTLRVNSKEAVELYAKNQIDKDVAVHMVYYAFEEGTVDTDPIYDIAGTCQTIVKAGNGKGTFNTADKADELASKLQSISQLTLAMINDPIAKGFSLASDVTVQRKGKSESTIKKSSVANNTIIWVPAEMKMEKDEWVTLTYTVELSSVPSPLTAANKEGKFPLAATNGAAFAQYTLDGEAYKPAFPNPTVKYETGNVEVYQKLGAAEPEKADVPSNAINVITDYYESDAIVDIRRMPPSVTQNKLSYNLTGIQLEGEAGKILLNNEALGEMDAAALKASLEGTGEVPVALPTGYSKIIFVYGPGKYQGEYGSITINKTIDWPEGKEEEIPETMTFNFTLNNSGYEFVDADGVPVAVPTTASIIINTASGDRTGSITLNYIPLDDEGFSVKENAPAKIRGYAINICAAINKHPSPDTISHVTDTLSPGRALADKDQFNFLNQYGPAEFAARVHLEKEVYGLAPNTPYTFTFAVEMMRAGEWVPVTAGNDNGEALIYTMNLTTDANGYAADYIACSELEYSDNKIFRFTELDPTGKGGDVYAYESTTVSSTEAHPSRRPLVNADASGPAPNVTLRAFAEIPEEGAYVVTFVNSYSSGGGGGGGGGGGTGTMFDPIPLGAPEGEEEEIPLGPPMTGDDMVTAGILALLSALALVKTGMVLKRRLAK